MPERGERPSDATVERELQQARQALSDARKAQAAVIPTPDGTFVR